MPNANRAPVAKSPIASVLALQPTAKASHYELLIYGIIGTSYWEETVTAANVVAQLDSLPADATDLHVRINSFGGSVPDGLAIHNALKRCSATVTVTVDGVAASVASLIAMAGDEVRMPGTSVMMVHDPRMDWVELANAGKLRELADTLDTWTASAAVAYAAKTGMTTDEVMAQLLDGKDHYFTGEEAVAAKLADTLEAFDTATADPTVAAALEHVVARAPDHIRELVIAAAARHPVASPIPAASTPPSHRAAPAATTTGALPMSQAPTPAPKAEPAADAATITAQAHTALRTRNDEIRAVLEPYKARTGIDALLLDSLTDPTATVDSVRAKALALVGKDSTPSAPSGIEMGPDETDKIRAAGTDYLLARANVLTGEAAIKARQGNPFNGNTMMDMARSFAARGGVVVQGMSRDQIIAAAITHSTSDFSIVLENALHKTVVNAYNQQESSWRQFCGVSTLSDFRAHNRYYLSSFSDLKPVKENGEYEDGTISDAEKETITAKSKGRIINLSREIIINDDMGVFTQIAVKLGQAAGRTIEKDVYALLALNSGNGPTMSDGKALFHVDHGNIGTAAAPSVTAFDEGRVLMGKQMDPGSNDFVGIRPAIWLGPLGIGGDARVVNDSQYDPDSANKLQRPNKVRGLFATVVDTPRLSGTGWYMLADPSMEPVFEVGFLDGNQLPTIVAEDSFRSNGRSWRVSHDYGVAAVGYRGALKNAGA